MMADDWESTWAGRAPEVSEEGAALLGVSEVAANCPCCGAPVLLLIDASVGIQSYIEDCEVCCQPMTVNVVSVDPVQVHLQHEDEV